MNLHLTAISYHCLHSRFSLSSKYLLYPFPLTLHFHFDAYNPVTTIRVISCVKTWKYYSKFDEAIKPRCQQTWETKQHRFAQRQNNSNKPSPLLKQLSFWTIPWTSLSLLLVLSLLISSILISSWRQLSLDLLIKQKGNCSLSLQFRRSPLPSPLALHRTHSRFSYNCNKMLNGKMWMLIFLCGRK